MIFVGFGVDLEGICLALLWDFWGMFECFLWDFWGIVRQFAPGFDKFVII